MSFRLGTKRPVKDPAEVGAPKLLIRFNQMGGTGERNAFFTQPFAFLENYRIQKYTFIEEDYLNFAKTETGKVLTPLVINWPTINNSEKNELIETSRIWDRLKRGLHVAWDGKRLSELMAVNNAPLSALDIERLPITNPRKNRNAFSSVFILHTPQLESLVAGAVMKLDVKAKKFEIQAFCSHPMFAMQHPEIIAAFEKYIYEGFYSLNVLSEQSNSDEEMVLSGMGTPCP